MNLKGIFPAFDISASGLSAQRRRMNAIASNIANAETTQTDEGGPYRRRIVRMSEGTERYGFKKIFDSVRSTLLVTNPKHRRSQRILAPVRETLPRGVASEEIVLQNSEPRLVYDPNHPDADEDGYVAMPNINVVTEMVDMIVATRAYEANITAIQAAKEMAKKSLEI
jgi:flagellar basal-body rod protein FlgC